MKVTTGLLKGIKELELLDTFCGENEEGDLEFTEGIVESRQRCFDFKELEYDKKWNIFEDDNGLQYDLQWFNGVYVADDKFLLRLDCVNNHMKLEVMAISEVMKDKGTYWRTKNNKFEVICQNNSNTFIDSNQLCLGEVGDVCEFKFENNRRLEKWVGRLIRAKKGESLLGMN